MILHVIFKLMVEGFKAYTIVPCVRSVPMHNPRGKFGMSFPENQYSYV